MESEVVKRIVKLLVKAGYQLGKEDPVNAILTEIARVEGAAASRTLLDAQSSNFPANEVRSAITSLRGAYEKYHRRSLDISLRERVRSLLGATGGPKARFDSAVVALTIAYLYKWLGDDGERRLWLERGTGDFLASYEAIPALAQSGTRHKDYWTTEPNPADPIGASQRTVTHSYIEHYSTAQDYEQYAARKAALLSEFEAIREELK